MKYHKKNLTVFWSEIRMGVEWAENLVENKGLKFQFERPFSIYLFHAMTRKYLLRINNLDIKDTNLWKTLDLIVTQWFFEFNKIILSFYKGYVNLNALKMSFEIKVSI